MRRDAALHEFDAALRCPYCGRELRGTANFCTGCGANLSDVAPSAQPLPAESPHQTGGAVSPRRLGTKEVLIVLAVVLGIACAALGAVIVTRLNGANAQGDGTDGTVRTVAKANEEQSGDDEEPEADESGESDSSAKTAAAADAKASTEAEHAQIREDAVAQGMQVIEGTIRFATLYDLAMEKGGQSLASNFSSSRDTVAVLNFDHAQTVTGNSGDGMGTRSLEISSIELEGSGGSAPADGTHVCIGVYQKDVWFESSVKFDVVPAHSQWTLLYEGDDEQGKAAQTGDSTKASGSSTAKVASAYDAILDNASSYFSEAWYDQHPDSEITYALAEASGDDVPELFLMAHYSNVGSHTSGGIRYIPFTYDEATGAAVEATNDEYALFADAWWSVEHAASGHSLVAELRYFRGMDNAYFRYVVSGSRLTREEISAEEYDPDDSLGEGRPCSDRSLVDALR